jgi:cytochrome P450
VTIRENEVAGAGDDYDPFETFSRGAGAGTVRDPYPEWAELRKQVPIVQGDPRQLFGLGAEVELPPDLPPMYLTLTLDAALHVLRDGATFSSSHYAMVMGPVMGHTILEMDEPEHHAYRGLIQQAFTRKAMERWEAGLVAPIVARHIDAFADHGRADLVRELTFPFPVHVIAGLLGLPEDDLPMFHRLAVELISVSFSPGRGMAASSALRDYFAGVLADRRATPRHDVVSELAQAELNGQRLTDEEIYAFLRLLLPAGAETTYRSSSNLLFGLLSNPDQLEALQRDRSLLDQAIEEGLRWEPPLTSIMRMAAHDTDVCGVAVPAGALISVCMGAANRDPAHWDDPDRFQLHRPVKPNAAFASGPHMCLGMHLARMETRVVMSALLDRLPGLALDPEAEDVHITGKAFRAPSALPVVFG